jgi:hypothetical protein
VINYDSVKSNADDFFNLLFYPFLELRFEENTSINTSFTLYPKHV